MLELFLVIGGVILFWMLLNHLAEHPGAVWSLIGAGILLLLAL